VRATPDQYHCDGRIRNIARSNLADYIFGIIAIDEVLAVRAYDLRNENALITRPVPDEAFHFGSISAEV
jgi:hypothetical protein